VPHIERPGGNVMLAMDHWQKDLAGQGFVPYGEVVRLRRLCWLAWAMVVVALIVVFGATMGVPQSFRNELASPQGEPQPATRNHPKGSSLRPLPKSVKAGQPLAAFLVDTSLQIGYLEPRKDGCN